MNDLTSMLAIKPKNSPLPCKAVKLKRKRVVKKTSILSKSLISKKLFRSNKKTKTRKWDKRSVLLSPNASSKTFASKISVWCPLGSTPPPKLFAPSSLKKSTKSHVDKRFVENGKSLFGDRFSVDFLKMALDLIDKRGINFYVATSMLNSHFKRESTVKYSLEEIKQLYFQLSNDGKGPHKFDYSFEQLRKKELNLLHNRSAETEAKILQLCVDKKAIYDELGKRKVKKDIVGREDSISQIGDIQSILNDLPHIITQNLELKYPDKKCYVISSLTSLPFENVEEETSQCLNEYLFSMLNYDQNEPVKITTFCLVKLWSELRRKIIILERLKATCKRKRKVVNEIESAMLVDRKEF